MVRNRIDLYIPNVVQYEQCNYKQCGSVLLFTNIKCGHKKMSS